MISVNAHPAQTVHKKCCCTCTKTFVHSHISPIKNCPSQHFSAHLSENNVRLFTPVHQKKLSARPCQSNTDRLSNVAQNMNGHRLTGLLSACHLIYLCCCLRYKGSTYIGPMTGDFVVLEVNGVNKFSYDLTVENSGCRNPPQSWREMRLSTSNDTPPNQAWHRGVRIIF